MKRSLFAPFALALLVASPSAHATDRAGVRDLAAAIPGGAVQVAGDPLPSNTIIDMEAFGPHLWIATGGGLARFTPDPGSSDPTAGQWASWGHGEGIGRGGVSGLAVGATSWGDTLVWVATAFDTLAAGESLPAGGGLSFSADLGATWTWIPQPVDDRNETEYSPTTTVVQNVTYDISLAGDTVWIASFGGGLRRFAMTPQRLADRDSVRFQVVPPDDNPFSPVDHPNHIAFSTATLGGLLAAGTSAGVNLSADGGETWRNSDHDPQDNATLTGNWVVALNGQTTSSGRHLLWASTRATTGDTEFSGVSVSEDGGLSWRRVLGAFGEPVVANNFAFDDSVVYVAANSGLYKSADFGATWGQFPPIHDTVSGERTYSGERISVSAGLNRLWVGTYEGLAVSANGGLDWRLMRTFPAPDSEGTPAAYAYPNPFSPRLQEVVRIQYVMERAGHVTLEIYDFAMELVIKPIDDEPRAAGDHVEVWDGLGPGGETIANGVYFFRLSGGGKTRWGKILILH